MSEYIHTKEFQDERERIMQICKSDPDLMVGVEKTVPESKIEEERKKGFWEKRREKSNGKMKIIVDRMVK